MFFNAAVMVLAAAVIAAPSGLFPYTQSSVQSVPSSSSSSLRNQSGQIRLGPGDVQNRKLNGAGKHLYSVQVDAGKCLRLLIEQKGIDVMVALKDPNGNILKKTDRPSGAYGPETVTYIAAKSGILNVEVTAFIPDAPDGGYDIRYLSLDTPTSLDVSRAEAEDLTSAAEEERTRPARESKLNAIDTFQKALAIWTRLGDKFEQAVVYYGIGFTQYNLSDHYSAATNFYKALKLNSEMNFQFGQAVNHSALGAAQYATGEYELAEYNYLRALAIHRKSENLRGLGVATHGLGTVYMLEERYTEALRILEESKSWRERANDNSGRTLTGLTLANVHLLMKDPAAAQDELVRVSSILGAERSSANSQYLYYLGRTLSALNNHDEALAKLSAALTIFNREGNRLRQAQTLHEMSRARFAKGALDQALDDISQGTEKIEELRRTTPNFRARVMFSATVESFYEQHIKVLLALHRTNPKKRYDALAFDVAEKARSRGLLDTLERRSLIRKRIIDPLLLEKENTLRDQLSLILGTPPSRRMESDLTRLQEISAEYSETEAEINRQLIAPESQQISTLTTVEVQRLLSDDVAIVSYAFLGETLVAWILTDKEISSFDIGSSVEATRLVERAFNCFSSPPTTRSSRDCKDESTDLGDLLLGPITDVVGTKKLIFVKHDALERLPVAALINPKTGRYLIETNEVSELPSASVLKILLSDRRPAPKTLALFADPVYSAKDSRLKGAAISDAIGVPVQLPRLFASRFEAERIKSLIPVGEAEVKIDFFANRDSFFSVNLSRFRLIHFAAHAVVDDTAPESSAIVMSLFDERGLPRPGLVRSNDIQRLDLNAELVVLSACRTGVGKQIKGEGFASLAQSFFSVGAEKVMFSRWEVDDKVTAETMVRFYRKLISEKLTPTAALRQTQISLLTDRRWSHPYYWAAFTLQGSH